MEWKYTGKEDPKRLLRPSSRYVLSRVKTLGQTRLQWGHNILENHGFLEKSYFVTLQPKGTTGHSCASSSPVLSNALKCWIPACAAVTRYTIRLKGYAISSLR